MKKFRTPQEKKRLSYEKDCRNTYGESDKGSRKTIRRNKTIRNQIYRRKVKQVLNDIENTKLETAERIDSEAKSIAKGKWKKCSDTPLGFFVDLQKDMRKRRIGRKTSGTLRKSKLTENFFNKLKSRRK